MLNHSRPLSVLLLLPLLMLVASCGGGDAPSPSGDSVATAPATDTTTSVQLLDEAFVTDSSEADNVDSPALWHGPNGEHWIIVTAKETDALLVYNAADGSPVRRVGTTGSGTGQMRRPNGLAVIDDLAVVVERDNHRIQVFRLPDFTPLGAFGQDDLIKPYGLTLFPDSGAYVLYVTDNYETADEQVPADAELGRRVHRYVFSVADGRVESRHVQAFGDTAGDGVLHVVESIIADPEHNHLVIAEEEEGNTQLKIYTLEGTFTGRTVGNDLFKYQAEGIALYRCGSDGYWIATDQSHEANVFHLFDRTSFEHLGAFKGALTANTDGIALSQQGFAEFPAGVFVAVHDDKSLAAFSWEQVAALLELRSDCAPSALP